MVPRDTRLGRLYKVSAECATERKSLRTAGTRMRGGRLSSRGGACTRHCPPAPFCEPLHWWVPQGSLRITFMKFDFCYSPKVLIHLHI